MTLAAPHPQRRGSWLRGTTWLTVGMAAAMLAGCATPVPTAKPATGLAELMERPGERALFDGLRAYDDGQYPQAETALQRALSSGLKSARDRATAHKLLAFVYCTSGRMAECEAAFQAAKAADPAFALSRSEAGHPLWGPVYQGTAKP